MKTSVCRIRGVSEKTEKKLKWQTNPKYGNLSRNFRFGGGEGGGSTQAVSLTALSQFFFWRLPLVFSTDQQIFDFCRSSPTTLLYQRDVPTPSHWSWRLPRVRINFLDSFSISYFSLYSASPTSTTRWTMTTHCQTTFVQHQTVLVKFIDNFSILSKLGSWRPFGLLDPSADGARVHVGFLAPSFQMFRCLLPGMHKCHNLPRYKEDSKVRSHHVEDDTAVASLEYKNKY